MFFSPNPLAQLNDAEVAFIKQEVEIFEAFTGCETPNRYHVFIKTFNNQYIYLFKCKEQSNWCERNCCR